MNEQVETLDYEVLVLGFLLLITVIMISCLCPYVLILRNKEHAAKILQGGGLSNSLNDTAGGDSESTISLTSEL